MCANLPYVPTGELPNLAPELAYEPQSALDGGPDGLDVVRRLLDLLPKVTERGGVAFLEIGADQGDAIVREVAERLPRCAVRRACPTSPATRASSASTSRPRERGLERPPGSDGRPAPGDPARRRLPGPADRARPRRDGDRARLPGLRPDGGGDPGGRRARREGLDRHRPDAELGGRLRAPARPDRPDRRPPGRGRAGDGGAPRAHRRGGPAVPGPGGPHPPPHADGRARSRARRSPGASPAASTPTSTTWSGSSSGAATRGSRTTPGTSAPRRRSSPTSRRRSASRCRR